MGKVRDKDTRKGGSDDLGNSEKTASDPVVGNVADDSDGAFAVVESAAAGQGDEWDELFADIDENVRVYVYRRAPAFYNGKEIAGFLGVLPVGGDIEYIRQAWGGGYYHLQKKRRRGPRGGFTFDKSYTLRIAGDPKSGDNAISLDAAVTRPELSPANPQREKVRATVDIDGHKIETDDPEFFDQLNKSIILRGIFQTPPQGASGGVGVKELLDVLKLGVDIARGNGSTNASLADRIEEMKAIRELSTEITPGDGGGDAGIGGIVRDLLPVLLAGSIKQTQPPPRNAGAIAALRVPGDDAKRKESEVVADKTQILMAVIAKAGEMIKAGFVLDPPKEPERIAALLLMLHRPDDEIRNYVGNNRAQIFDLLELDLADEFIDAPEGKTRADFEAYFGKIVDRYLGAS